MKLIWFGGKAFRLLIGGEIIVIDPDTADSRFQSEEVTSAADRVIDLAETDLPAPPEPEPEEVPGARTRLIDRINDDERDAGIRAFRDANGHVGVQGEEEHTMWFVADSAEWSPVVGQGDALVVSSKGALEVTISQLANAQVELLLAISELSEDDWSDIRARCGELVVHWLDAGLGIEL